jgi:hypothetical protein
MKKLIIIALAIGAFAGILYSYGAFDNLPDPDKALVSGLNNADKSIDRAVEKQATRTILNKNRP